MSSATVPSGAAPAATTAPAQAGTDATATAGQLPAGRQVIVTGSITVRVPDVRAAVADIQAQVTAAGGYLSGSNIVGDADLPIAHLTFRIPSERYDAVVSAAGRVGELLSQRSDTEDVTAQVVDLDARASALETSIGRLEGFLGAAADVEELARIEAELTERETALEQIRAQQRDLGDDVAYATLDVEIVTVGAVPDEPARARVHEQCPRQHRVPRRRRRGHRDRGRVPAPARPVRPDRARGRLVPAKAIPDGGRATGDAAARNACAVIERPVTS